MDEGAKRAATGGGDRAITLTGRPAARKPLNEHCTHGRQCRCERRSTWLAVLQYSVQRRCKMPSAISEPHRAIHTIQHDEQRGIAPFFMCYSYCIERRWTMRWAREQETIYVGFL